MALLRRAIPRRRGRRAGADHHELSEASRASDAAPFVPCSSAWPPCAGPSSPLWPLGDAPVLAGGRRDAASGCIPWCRRSGARSSAISSCEPIMSHPRLARRLLIGAIRGLGVDSAASSRGRPPGRRLSDPRREACGWPAPSSTCGQWSTFHA